MEVEAPTRTLRERAYALAQLFVFPRSPRDYLRGSTLSTGGHRVRVVSARSECEGTTTLTLSPAPASFLPGQHVDVSVLVDGAFQTRTFSISSAPGARTFDVTIRAAARGRVTPLLVSTTKAGDELRVSAPKGDFVLSGSNTEPLLFVTAGSGITPVMSMLRDARDRSTLASRDVVHVHFERTRARVLFDGELTALSKTHATYVRTCVLTGDAIDVESMLAKVREACPDLATRRTYACGPAPLLDAMRALYKDMDLPDRLSTESFGLPSSLYGEHGEHGESGEDASEAGRISFTKSQVHVDADGRTSLLVLAERAGLKPVHGCRRGLCHSCEAPLVSGTVRDLRTGMLTQGTGGCVQLCICAPMTDVEVAL